MLAFKHIVLAAITLAFSCSAADAQLKIRRVAKFGDPNEGRRRFTGGREVEFSDDETKIITAFYGCIVQLFDLKKNESIGDPIRTSGDGEVGFVNNEIAYTADWESVRLWDTKSGQQIGNEIPHELREDTIISPAISLDGRYIATRATMKSVQLWNVSTRKLIGKPRSYSTVVHSIRFTDDGGLLIVKAGGSLYAIDTDTGDDVVGPVASGWRFYHFAKQQKLVTTEQVLEGSYQLVIRSTDQKSWPVTHRSNLPGKLKRIVALDDNQFLVQTSKNDYTPAMFIISLDKPTARIEVESDADRAFGLIVSQDKRYWICSNIRNFSCQKFGEAKPVWQKQIPPSGYDQHPYPLNNEYFIIRDKQDNFGVYEIADGSEVWTQPGVKKFSTTKNKIAICSSDGVEIWEME